MTIRHRAPTPLTRATSPLRGTTGILVEDDVRYRTDLQRLLTSWGTTISVTFACVEAALAAPETCAVDWLIIDNTLTTFTPGALLAAWVRDVAPQVVRISHSASDPAIILAQVAADAAQQPAPHAPLFHAVVAKPAAIITLIVVIAEHLPHTRTARTPGG